MHNGVFKTLEEVIDFIMTAVGTVWDLICKTKRYPKTN
jgi:hypothetical protein